MSLERFQLNGAVVVITGGGGLLGRKHAEAIVEIGGVPALVDLNLAQTETVAHDIHKQTGTLPLVYQADITQEAEITKVLVDIKSKFKQAPQGLINNAAIDPKFDREADKVPKSRLEVFSLEQWDRELRVGLTGSFLCAKVFGSAMAEAGKGVILNISSDLGLIAPDQRLYQKDGVASHMQDVKPVTYSVIKHGLIGLTKYLATYWAAQGVRCNAFAPGGVFNNHPEEFVNKISKLIPLGRMADRDEYKSAVQFLISEASSYMTGSVMAMDGGRSVW